MSTFNGQIVQFPDIRVDNFCQIEDKRRPLAGFLSHIHSDHLSGLESLKAPFIYCSAATKGFLLRLERYPQRINFQLGVLESRKQHYKHLKNLLKPLPLETPTSIELAPGNVIQITLFDANHCTGAVMFLFEGEGQAVLYTGDIRAEPWFVNSLIRNPLLIEYTSGLKNLDCIYLDTSFKGDVPFPTKAEGIAELLLKVAAYPSGTRFHMAARTFGYEEVWIALSKALNTPVHIDKYKMNLYQALGGRSETDEGKMDDINGPAYVSAEAPALIGHQYANRFQAGCLTNDPSSRMHSCEEAVGCIGLDENTVWIRPILARMPAGKELNEIDTGGETADLSQRSVHEVDYGVHEEQIMSLLDFTGRSAQQLKQLLVDELRSSKRTLSLDEMNLDLEGNRLFWKELIKIPVSAMPERLSGHSGAPLHDNASHFPGHNLPKLITFPYSRHSSYRESCSFVNAFKPYDVYPCTVDEKNWHEGVSMKALFGHCCSGNIFRHDGEMRNSILYLNKTAIDIRPVSFTTWDLVEIQESPTHSSDDSIRERKVGDIMNQDKCSRLSQVHCPLGHVEIPGYSYNVDGGGLQTSNDNCKLLEYFDVDDGIHRCIDCNWEMWGPAGTCSGCGVGDDTWQDEDEHLDSETESVYLPLRLQACGSLHANLNSSVCGEYLDGSSAYDSVSDAENEQYEINSFIDDDPVESGNTIEEGESGSDLSLASDSGYEGLHYYNEQVGLAGCLARLDYHLESEECNNIIT